ncbi:tetratricopeptide repeat protein [Pedobacter arcticus]|uniref:tetratricopeptide repeat protein n=1 Tax=Pedobacter arcticus TaxID=752140 RepID=UPI000A0686E2|nr:tetratricopeptide repeat protein [Pedobacter arcticus]
MNLRSIFTALLALFCIGVSAQPKKNKNQPLIILSGSNLSLADSNKVIDLYYSGLREKVVENQVLAIESFNQAVKIDPLHHPSYYELGQIYFKKGDLSNARIYAEKAVTIETHNEWYWLLIANIYQQQQNYNLLDYALNELIKIAPDKVEYGFDKANALFMMGSLDESLALYNNLELKVGLTDAVLQGRQRIYLKKGDVKKAVADLEQLIKNNPSDVRYYLFLGDLFYANKMLVEALKVYQQAKQLDDSNPFTRMAIAQILDSQKRPAEAYEEVKVAFAQPSFNIDQKVKIIIKYFDAFPDVTAVAKAEELSQIITIAHPTDPKPFSLYGDVLYQKQDFKGAKLAYQKALSLNKNVFVIWDQLLRIELFDNDTKALIKDGEEALTLFPNQFSLYFYVGMGYLIEKNYAKAITYLNNTLAYDIDNKELKTQIYSSLGDAYQGEKKYKESVVAYEQALALDPNNSYTLNNYAYYLSLRDEDLQKAEKMSVKSNQLEKENASFQDTYAWILFKLEKYKEARDWMQKAILNNPNSAVQFEHLGDIFYKLGDTGQALENWNKSLKIDTDNPLLKKKINEKKYFD